jgi:hypothetical protein
MAREGRFTERDLHRNVCSTVPPADDLNRSSKRFGSIPERHQDRRSARIRSADTVIPN